MDDAIRKFIKEACETPLEELVTAAIAPPRCREQFDLEWQGVKYQAKRMELRGESHWDILFDGLIRHPTSPKSDYLFHLSHANSLAGTVFTSLAEDLFGNAWTLSRSIEPPHDRFMIPYLNDLQTGATLAKQFIDRYTKYRKNIESAIEMISRSNLREFGGCDIFDYEDTMFQQLRDGFGLDFIVHGYRDSGNFHEVDYITKFDGVQSKSNGSGLVNEYIQWKSILRSIPTDMGALNGGPKCRSLKELFKDLGDAVYFTTLHKTTDHRYVPYIRLRVPYPDHIKPFSKAVASTAFAAVETAKIAIMRYVTPAQP